MALKKVALRKLEDGIPNQALREIKALQEIEDNQHVSPKLLCTTLEVSAAQLYLSPLHLFMYSGGEAQGRLSPRHWLRPGF